MRAAGVPGKVLHVLSSPGVGGCESLCVNLIEYLNRAGWGQEVVFLCDGPGPTQDVLMRIHDLSIHTVQYDPCRRWGFVQRFAELCRARRVDTVIAYSFGLHFFVALGARLGSVRRVLACVQNPPPTDTRARRVTTLLAQIARPFVSHEVACSRYVAGQVTKVYRLPKRRVVVVHNWCDVERIATRAAVARRSRTCVGPVFGMIARLDPIKDHTTVLRAFARFLVKYPDARLRLIGDGPSRSILEALERELALNGSVEFVGTRLDVPEQLGSLDMFVYATTQQEGFGIVLAETMAASVPIVATDVGPCAEVLDGGRAGLLVPPQDPEALTAGMETLWQDADLRARLAAAGFATAQKRYSVYVAVRRLEELLRD